MSLRRRLVVAVLTLCVVITITFFLLRAMPGDIITMRAQEMVIQQGIPYEQALELVKAQLGYDPDAPLLQQFLTYVTNLLRGNLGTSIIYRAPVSEIVARALPWTLFLSSLALAVSFIVGVTLGLVAAWHRGKWLDTLITSCATALQSFPDFLIGIVLLVIFGVNLRWFPLRGAYSIDVTPGFNMAFITDVLYHAALPSMAYALVLASGWILSMRGSATTVLSENYVYVAKAKGLRPWRILLNYIGRNAIIPLIPALFIRMGTMLGGSIFVETIFNYPGMGYFLARAIALRDYVLIQGLLLIMTIAVITLNVLSDVVYFWLDPRVRER